MTPEVDEDIEQVFDQVSDFVDTNIGMDVWLYPMSLKFYRYDLLLYVLWGIVSESRFQDLDMVMVVIK